MTKNQQMLLIMSWARSFHGLALSDCEALAEKVLEEEFNGSIEDARPSAVMSAFDKVYFTANSRGEVMPGHNNVPTWEEHGVVRPPQKDNDTGNNVVLSDGTNVSAQNLSLYFDENVNLEMQTPQTAGAHPDGSLVLVSGGVVPPLSKEKMDIVWPTVFSDPVGHTQEKIDSLVENTPDVFNAQNFVEDQATITYNAIVEDANALVEERQSSDQHDH